MYIPNKKKLDWAIIIFTCVTLLYVAVSLYKITISSAPDFPSYYLATIDLIQGENPYLDKRIPNIFIYPAVTSVFYLPLIIFPYTIAQAIFVILSALAVPLIVYISLKLIYKRYTWRHFLIFTSFSYLAFPTKFTLGMGQVNLLAFLILLLGFFLYKRKRIILSGILIAIAFLAKPILCFLLIFFIIEKAWRTMLIIIATLLAIILFSFILYGTESELYYLNTMVPTLIGGVEGRDVYYNQGIMGFISRLTENTLLTKSLSIALGLTLVGISLLFLIRIKTDTNMKFALFITLLLIVHTLSWQHYFVFLIFPYILTAKIILERKNYKLLLLLIFSYLLISLNIKGPLGDSQFPYVLLLSHTLYGALLLILLQYKLVWITYKSK